MPGAVPDALLLEIKSLIAQACDRPDEAARIQDDAPLFGPYSALGLDSLDALQLSMAIQKRYGLRLTDSKQTRRILASARHLAQHVQAFLAARPAA